MGRAYSPSREEEEEMSVHGTHAGYQVHRRRGEVACDPCKAANATYVREYRRRATSTLVPVPRDHLVRLWRDGYTLTEIAARVGVSAQSVSRWLNGSRKKMHATHAYALLMISTTESTPC